MPATSGRQPGNQAGSDEFTSAIPGGRRRSTNMLITSLHYDVLRPSLATPPPPGKPLIGRKSAVLAQIDRLDVSPSASGYIRGCSSGCALVFWAGGHAVGGVDGLCADIGPVWRRPSSREGTSMRGMRRGWALGVAMRFPVRNAPASCRGTLATEAVSGDHLLAVLVDCDLSDQLRPVPSQL